MTGEGSDHHGDWRDKIDASSRAGMASTADLLALEQSLDALELDIAAETDPTVRLAREHYLRLSRLGLLHQQQFVRINHAFDEFERAVCDLDERLSALERRGR